MYYDGVDELAVKTLRAYAMKPKGLSEYDCDYMVDGDGEHFDKFQCDLLQDILEPGAGGDITTDEFVLMEEAGFPEGFIESFEKLPDGFAIRQRAKGLAQELTRVNHYERKIAIMSELSTMGTKAIEALPTVLGVLQSKDMRMDRCDTIMYDIRHFPFMQAMSVWHRVMASYPKESVIGDPLYGFDGRLDHDVLPEDVIGAQMQIASAFAIANMLGEREEDHFSWLHKTIPVAAPTCLE